MSIELPEVPTLKSSGEYICEHCGKVYKTKKNYEKHLLTHPETFENLSEVGEGEFETIEVDKDTEKLRSELMNIMMNNPQVDLNSPVSTLGMDKVNAMSKVELQSRIFDAKRQLNTKLDSSISNAGLSVVNLIVGNLLGCVEELNNHVNNDKILQDAAKDLLAFNILNKIPPPIKVTGLYGINVALALKESKLKQLNNSEE